LAKPQFFYTLASPLEKFKMAVGLIGIKSGMTRVFNEAGDSAPVTVIRVDPNYISQLKREENEGYSAIQVTVGTRTRSRLTKPEAGHFKKAGVEAGRVTREFRVSAEDLDHFKLGDLVTVDRFTEIKFVDVCAITKGKGFQGGVKRHNFKMQDASHGNSLSHRAIGSTGQCQSPGRVFKGKKMPGQMCNVSRTIQNQSLLRVDLENQLLLIKGAVPGPCGRYVIVLPSVKKKGE